MRARAAKRFTLDDLPKITKICREKNVKTYITLNVVMYNEDLQLMKKICDTAKKAKIDAVICTDIAAIKYAHSIDLEVHISTQANVSNIEAVKFYSQFADVIVLARELNLNQINEIIKSIKKEKIEGPKGELIKIELFVHGALCVSISGKCYMSLAQYNHSANRGDCLQVCRRSYKVTDEETGDELMIDNKFVMSPKDLCTIGIIDKIIESGVSVFKIEGRGRSPDYVYTTVKVYKEAVDNYFSGTYTKEKIDTWIKELEKVFNRGFWQGGYYLGNKLGEWSGTYGSKSTVEKIYIGKVKNYFARKKIVYLIIETGEIGVGDEILITGPTTGVVKTKVKELYVNDNHKEKAKKGDLVTVPIQEKVRANDKLFVLNKKEK